MKLTLGGEITFYFRFYVALLASILELAWFKKIFFHNFILSLSL